VLQNVRLRVEAFDYLQLPVAVKHGSIGKLKLQVWWGRAQACRRMDAAHQPRQQSVPSCPC
jgi:hypothetical protein